MALSLSLNPHSTSLSSSPSHSSFSLLFLRPKPNFAFSPKPLAGLSVRCSQGLADPDTDQKSRRVEAVQRKKRKPKPSFLDQIHEKWSVKAVSQRATFPWQEKPPDIEEDKSPEKSIEAESPVLSDSVSSCLTSRGASSSAPWAHGSGVTGKPSHEPQLDTKPEPKGNGDIIDRKVYVSAVNRESDSKKRSGIQSGISSSREEARKFETGRKGFPLCETFNGFKKDGILEDSGYFSDEIDETVWESESEEEIKLETGKNGVSLSGTGNGFAKDGVSESSGYDSEDFDEDVWDSESDEETTIEKTVSLSETRNGYAKAGIFESAGYESEDFDKNELESESKEERNTESGKKGVSLYKTRNGYTKDGIFESSGYDSEDFEKNELESESKDERYIESGKKDVSLNETRNGYSKDGIFESSGFHSEEKNELERRSESDEKARWKWTRSNTAAAETSLPEHELRRLRNVSQRMPNRIKVGARGITQALVDTIRDRWELDEVVKLKFEEPLSLNMRRTHMILESKTGGVVIYRSGSLLVLYRGMSYKLPCVQSYTNSITHNEENKQDSSETHKGLSNKEVKRMKELNEMLDGLGPRFADWSGRPPFPVDADALEPLVSGFKTPFRVLAYGVRHCLRNHEMTRFRRIARTMPPHFALGRNRELQGLAQAIVKLWEKSAIAKIAIKRGVENTRNETMAEDLKRLTGGTLVSRNKEYIVFYRGNDFVPPSVSEALEERRKVRDLMQDEEERVRKNSLAFIEHKSKASTEELVAGTLAETKAAAVRWGRSRPTNKDFEKMVKDSSVSRLKAIIKHLEKNLMLGKGNLTRAEKAIAKLQKDLKLSDLPDDLEILTEEERVLFRKMGLSMKPFLLLGKRGFYGGTIENIHLHWKHRELVKVIMKAKHLEHVKHVAVRLEAESGGVLVSVDEVMKGFAIVLYRGKNYRMPDKLKPPTLLTKRQALARSKEVQRREALRRHVSDLKERIELLKLELEEKESGNGETVEDGKVSFSAEEEYSFSPKYDELDEDDLQLQDSDSDDHEEECFED